MQSIGIIGGGNIGTELAIELTNSGHTVYLQTNKPELFHNPLLLINNDTNEEISASIHSIANDYKLLCENVNCIIVTSPSNSFDTLEKDLEPYIRRNTKLVVLPGTGGSEYVFRPLINKGCILIGLQRVPAVYRLKEYGKIATVSGKRKDGLYAGSVPKIADEELISIVEELFGLPCHALPNYLNVTLTPSNPILHTSRLFSLFSKEEKEYGYSKNPLFYGEWDDVSSANLIACNDELMRVKDILSTMDLSYVKSLLVHYESTDIISLTRKITSIQSLHNIGSPMIEKEGKFYVDYNSRYFTADFPHGLLILKAICLLLGLDSPKMDEIIFWYQKMVSKEYLVDHLSFGKDIKECHIPQNYGILTKEELINYYK